MRKMATLRIINDINDIPGADKLCVYIIDGWGIVDHIGKYNKGQLVIMCEVDSWIPHEVAPFLTPKDRSPKEYNGVLGERLKTVKLRGQLSQGLILPFDQFFDIENNEYHRLLKPGDDVSDFLGIIKWERPIPAQLAGLAKGNFPTEIPKTDQERCQNLVYDIRKWSEDRVVFEKTEKLDGSSCTFYLDIEGNFQVCSRNLSLKEDGKNTFWKMAEKYDIRCRMNEANLYGYALQGEVIGEGIQGNRYKIKGHEFRLFDVYDVKKGKYLTPIDRESICSALGIQHVPVITFDTISYKVDDLLSEAEGVSHLNNKVEREGIVYKSYDGKISFKAISNLYLMKHE